MNNMTTKSIVRIGLFSLISSLCPAQLLAQQPFKAIQNPSSYEDDRIKIVVQDCTRRSQDTVCQATLTSKNSDRLIDINGSAIRLIDSEGNEYNPTSIRLGNRASENNSIKTELIESIPFKASFVFGRVPTSLTQVALLQIPLTGGVIATAKFRNVPIINRTGSSSATSQNNTSKAVNVAVPPSKSASVNRETSTVNTSVCPDNTKVLYRASSSDYLLYICGAKNPTHYVGLAKDGTQGITLRLRYYDRSQFSADNGDTNYMITANRLVIRKNNRVIFQDKIQVLQALTGTSVTEEVVPKVKPKKASTAVSGSSQKRSLTSPSPAKIRQQSDKAE